MNAVCVGIDWGTSHFRLWVLDGAGQVLGERDSGEGLVEARQAGFANVIENHINALRVPDSVPVVICGMAGSQQGWQEAPYLETPVELAEIPSGAITVDNTDRDIRILPGICQRNSDYPDVMRGEETQLLGAANGSNGKLLFCMPGTHSKWTSVSDGVITNFSTHMTGDLFSAIAKNTVLRFNTEERQTIDPNSALFLQSMDRARTNPAQITNQLFSVRSARLLDMLPAKEANAQISGALIGLEIAAAISRHGEIDRVTLVASAELGQLYAAAFNQCGIGCTMLDGAEMSRAGLLAAAKQIWLT